LCYNRIHLRRQRDFTIQIKCYAPSELGRQFREQLGAYRTYHSTLKIPQSGKTTCSPESNDARSQLEEKAKLATEILQAQFGEYIEEDPNILMPMELEAAIQRALNTKKPCLNQKHSFMILRIQVLHLLFIDWLLSMEMSKAISSFVKPSCMWRDR
jgi:hypothetical protein